MQSNVNRDALSTISVSVVLDAIFYEYNFDGEPQMRRHCQC